MTDGVLKRAGGRRTRAVRRVHQVRSMSDKD